MEQFRTAFFERFRLDPMQYVTLPGAAWAAMLKRDNVEANEELDPSHIVSLDVNSMYPAVMTQLDATHDRLDW
ncbi:unnamed protein product, partial [Symbiodinium necroappetens]